MVERKRVKPSLPAHQPEIGSIVSGQNLTEVLQASPEPFKAAYEIAEKKGKLARIERTVHEMVRKGVTEELDFILEKFPTAIQDLLENNEQAKDIFTEFGSSIRYLSYALGRAYQINYETIYRALKVSPIRPHLGDFTVVPHEEGFWDSTRMNVRVVEPRGADLSEIRVNFYIDRDFNEFSQNSEEYLQKLKRRIETEDNDKLKNVWSQVYGFYENVHSLELPALKRQIRDQFGAARYAKSGREVLFPSDHQKAAIVKAAQEKSLAVFDGTGSGKTAIGIGLAEHIGAERVLVVCPANIKQTWEQKLAEYYVDPPKALRIESQNSQRFIKGSLDGAKYVLVNYELLIDRQNGNGAENGNGEEEKISALGLSLMARDFDLMIVDEAHYINNSNKRSEAILEIAKKIENRLILTATPIRNSSDDVSRIAHLLAPNDFVTPDALKELGPSGFPLLCEILARKTIRRKTDDLLELPPFCPENNGEVAYVPVELNPTQRAVYEAIFQDPTLLPLTKVKLLRQASIDHNLLMGNKYPIPFDRGLAAESLRDAYKYWKKLKSRSANHKFDSDFLVKYGYDHLFLGTHFHFKGGANEFIQRLGTEEMKDSWEGTAESTKFQMLRDLIRSRLLSGEKVIVFTGHFVKGIIREVIDDVTGEKITQDLYSYLAKEFPEVEIGRIDGEVKPSSAAGKKSKRDLERERWQNDPEFKILLTSVSASGLGIDFSINDGVTKGVSVVGIDLPYTYADFWQMISRSYRLGQATPVNVFVLEAENTIDEGIHELILKKDEIAKQLLDGISPNELEEKLINRSENPSFLKDYVRSPKRELEHRMLAMRGKGVRANKEYLETVMEDGRTIGELIAQLYLKYWEYTFSGHTARLVRQTLDGIQQELGTKLEWVVDLGSGPLIMERVLKQESLFSDSIKVISVDINQPALESGVTAMRQLGYEVNEKFLVNKAMSETGIKDNSCDALVCSLALHYSKTGEDRGKILTEANRILKPGGFYIITLPDKYLSIEQYQCFVQALEKFGFTVDRKISGKAKAADYKEAPYSVWMVIARKTGKPTSDDITMDDFHFNFEGPKVSSYNPNRKQREHYGDEERESLVKHERFTLLDPDNGLKPRGSPQEILNRLALGLTEEKIKRYGWQIIERDKGLTLRR